MTAIERKSLSLSASVNLDSSLIDLLDRRHVQLRELSGKMWSENNDLYISNSEWLIMAKLYKKQPPTISYVAKQLHITRQATHKFIKQLEAKGLVEVGNSPHSKRDKCVSLTASGEQCVEENERIKAALVEKVTSEIGEEQVAQLQQLLRMEWGL